MRYIYYIFLSIVLLTGCNKHSALTGNPDTDTQIVPGSYIFFDAEVMETKATENLVNDGILPAANKTSFGIYGLRSDGMTPVFKSYSAGTNSPFDNVAIAYRPSRNATFRYDNLTLWHNGTHSFFAYYIKGVQYEYSKLENNDYSKTTNIISEVGVHQTMPYAKYVQPTAIEDMADVLTASVSTPPITDPVSFTFEHRLFSLDVVLRNSQTVTKTALCVTDAVVEFTVGSSQYLFFDGTVGEDPDATTCTITYDFIDQEVIVDKPSGNTPRDYNLNLEHAKIDRNYYTFLFLPCSSLKVKFDLTLLNSWDEMSTFTYDSEISVPGGFQAGHRYQFILTRNDNNGDDIPFTTSVEDWTNKDITHTFK